MSTRGDPADAIGRGFLALVPAGPVLDAVAVAQGAARAAMASPDRLRWTRREQWHVTLQFLGRVGSVVALRELLAPELARLPALACRLGEGGAFARPARATVLWVGVEDAAPTDPHGVGALAAAVADVTATLGHEREHRPFRGHVTLARAARPVDLRAAVAVATPPAAPGGGPPAWTATEVVLVASETRPEGARYREVDRFRLGPPPGPGPGPETGPPRGGSGEHP